MPYESLRSAAGEPFIVPTAGKNVAGGKEILRTMLSKEAATNFSKTKLAPDHRQGPRARRTASVRPRCMSQTKMLDAAGNNIFDYNFVDLYGMNKDSWSCGTRSCPGRLDVAGLTSGLQGITDKVAADSSIQKEKVTVVTAPPRWWLRAAGRSPDARRPARRLTFDRISFMVVFLGVAAGDLPDLRDLPFVQALYYSMTDWTGFSPNINFVGFDNYVKLARRTTSSCRSVVNNVLLAIVVAARRPSSSRSLFATLVTVAGGASHGGVRGLRGSGFYRVVSFFPYTVPGHRHRHHLGAGLRPVRRGCSTGSSPGWASSSSSPSPGWARSPRPCPRRCS